MDCSIVDFVWQKLFDMRQDDKTIQVYNGHREIKFVATTSSVY